MNTVSYILLQFELASGEPRPLPQTATQQQGGWEDGALPRERAKPAQGSCALPWLSIMDVPTAVLPYDTEDVAFETPNDVD